MRIFIEIARVGISLAIIGLGVVGFRALGTGKTKPSKVPPADTTPLVETVDLNVHDGGLQIKVDGVAVPYREIQMAAEVSGRIAVKPDACRAGRYVEKGELLLQIDDQDYRLAVSSLQKELEQAQANLSELDVEIASTDSLIKLATEDVTLQQREVARVLDLASRNAASTAERDKARRAEIATRNTLLLLNNQHRLQKTRRSRLGTAIELKRVELERAQLDLDRTKITAPISGVIVQEHVEQDSFVQKGSMLLTIDDTDKIEVRCSLRMDELYWLWSQTPRAAPTSNQRGKRDYEIPHADVSVIYQLAGRQFRWSGKLSRYEGIGLDEKTRTAPCRVVVENPTQGESLNIDPSASGPPALVRGMYVTVMIHTKPTEPLLRLPEQAVRPGNVVWLVRAGKLLRKVVEVAGVVEGDALISRGSSDVESGDKVVISPLATAFNGMDVRRRGEERKQP